MTIRAFLPIIRWTLISFLGLVFGWSVWVIAGCPRLEEGWWNWAILGIGLVLIMQSLWEELAASEPAARQDNLWCIAGGVLYAGSLMAWFVGAFPLAEGPIALAGC